MDTDDQSLEKRLSKILPEGLECQVFHIRTKPHKHEALLKIKKAPSTTLESHLLLLSYNNVFVFGIEILVYTTAALCTLFIAKVDSSGYLKLPLGPVTTVILQYIMGMREELSPEIRGQKHRIALFARSQNQYIFVESSQNKDKHILDDYGLIKWWMRALDPIPSHAARIVVPGLTQHEVERLAPSAKWTVETPFASHEQARNVIPYFPDDPKARFLDEIISEDRNIETEEFWESMAFRQECSLGRLTGFIWVDADLPSFAHKTNSKDLSRGVVVEPRTFQRCFDMLLRENFSSRQLAREATRSWIEGIGETLNQGDQWGLLVKGTKEIILREKTASDEANILAPRKKLKREEDVNVIDSSMIRRKKK